MTIKLNNYEYHRNGSGGDGFYAVAFTLTEEGESTELIAVLPGGLRDYDLNEGDVPAYIINPNDPLSKWRGDKIARDLIDAGVWSWIDEENERRFNELLAAYTKTNK
jgi:hypothetical protein